jgi:hypothetical protein
MSDVNEQLAGAVCARIFPSIGVARLGNSPEWFVGPEAPGHGPNPAGTFKDAAGWVKRQAARFRVYAYDADDQVVAEITADDATITWTVHLANKKASFHEFKGRYVHDPPLRNAHTQCDLAPDDRTALIIDPGARVINGRNVAGGSANTFDTGTIGPMTAPGTVAGAPGASTTAELVVPLGEVRTDHAGRLLVLAAAGQSGSVLDGHPITDYANNDYWYDDTADGPVTATVVLTGGRSLPVDGRAWCMCVPPHFATDITCVTTLWDQMEEVAGLADRPTLSFRHDVWPIFARVADYQWTNATALIGHGPAGQADFADPAMAARLADNRPDNRAFRDGIFMRVRDPALIPTKRLKRGEPYPIQSAEQADGYYMPAMCGDYGFVGTTQADPTTWLAVIPSQYDRLRRWRDGDFVDDWPRTGVAGLPAPPPFDEIPPADQPTALTRAALEHTIGAPFYPGIEMTYVVRHPALYSAPFRFADSLSAGDITRWMAMPWQADFFECNTFWWPAARPDDVVPASVYFAAVLAAQGTPGYVLTAATLKELSTTLPPRLATELVALVGVPLSSASDASWAFGQIIGAEAFEKYGAFLLERTRQTDFVAALGGQEVRRQWARGVGGPNDIPAGDNRLVDAWFDLGFVVPVVAPNGQRLHVETERASSLPETPPGHPHPGPGEPMP